MNRRAIRLCAGNDGKPLTMKDAVFEFSGFQPLRPTTPATKTCRRRPR